MDNHNVLAECRLSLSGIDCSDFISNKGSLLQGVLYEQLDSSYVEVLHEQGMKPYSQSILKEKDVLFEAVHLYNPKVEKGILKKLLGK